MEDLYKVQIEPGWKYVYVMAKDWNAAAKKAFEFSESTDAQSIIGKDGSLNLGKEQPPIKVKSVELLTEELIR